MATSFFALLFSLLALPTTLSSAQVPGFLANGPTLTVPASNRLTVNTYTFNVTWPYTNTTLLITSVNAITASVGGTTISSSWQSSSPHALLLPDSSYSPSAPTVSVLAYCQQQDVSHTSLCTVPVTLTITQTSPTYSLYYLTQCSAVSTCNLLGSSPLTSQPATAQWQYYVVDLDFSDLAVLFRLTSQYTAAALSLASEYSLFFPFFTSSNSSQASVSFMLTSSTLTSSGTNFYPGLLIIGINTPSPSPNAPFVLQVSTQQSTNSADPYVYGYSILSVLALILAAGLIILVLMRVCLIYRRRTALHITSSQMHLEGVVVGDLPTPVRAGLTEAEIAALSTHRFVGVEKFDEARCSVCLDDYVMHESLLRALPCNHSFHRDCIDQWLSAHKHCPLCLQSAKEGDKQKTTTRDVEMVRITARPTVAVPAVAPAPQAQLVDVLAASPSSALYSSSVSSLPTTPRRIE